MSSPYFGLIFDQQNDGDLPPVLADFSICGTALPSDDANPSVFPLNKAVFVNTGAQATLSAMGTGPLATLIDRINAQLADLERSAALVVVRVPTAKNPDGTENVAGTIANIIGDPAAGTGLYALLKAPQVTNYTPRLLGFPGYTGYTAYAVANPVVTHQGDDYTHPVVTFDPPGAAAVATVGNAGVTAQAHAVLGTGAAAGTVTGVAVDNAGQDYGAAPSVTVSGGGGTGCTAHAVLNTNGQVDHVAVDSPGTGYVSAPLVTLAAPAGGQITSIAMVSPGTYPPGTAVTGTIADSQGGTGTGATFTFLLEQLANPICAILPSINSKLLAHSFVGGPGGTKADALDWRTKLPADQRLIPEDDWEIDQSGASAVYVDGVAASMGLQVRTDFKHGGFPFWAAANVPVVGVEGLKRVDDFSLVDGATDGQELLTAGIGITVRGDLSDTSLSDSGFVKVLLNNCSALTNFNLYNKTRGRDFTNLALIKAIRQYMGNNNVTLHSVQAVLNAMTALMILLKSKECVIGFKTGFRSADNTTAGLRAGKFTVFDDSEEPAPIIQVTVSRGLDSDALVNELADLAAATTTVTS